MHCPDTPSASDCVNMPNCNWEPRHSYKCSRLSALAPGFLICKIKLHSRCTDTHKKLAPVLVIK